MIITTTKIIKIIINVFILKRMKIISQRLQKELRRNCGIGNMFGTTDKTVCSLSFFKSVCAQIPWLTSIKIAVTTSIAGGFSDALCLVRPKR